MAMKPRLSGTASPGFGSGPYGDKAEVSGPPTVTPVITPPGSFVASDARSIMITLMPNHYNFIKNPAFRTNTAGWETGAAASLLSTASWHVNAGSATSTRLLDLTGKGKDAVFGAGAAAPTFLTYDDVTYMTVPTGTASNNHLSGITPNIPATATMEWDIETTVSLGSGLYLIYNVLLNGAVLVQITSAGAFEVTTWVAGVAKTVSWAGAVVANTRRKYKVNLTTTGAELFVDGATQTLKTFGATRAPVANSSSVMLQTMGAATPTFYNIYAFNLYDAAIFDPTKHTDYATITNTGSQGGTWTVNRPTTGYKTTFVDRPLLLFGGAQTTTVAGYRPDGNTNPMTVLMAVRDTTASADTSYMLMAATTSAATTPGWYLYKPGSVSTVSMYAKDGTNNRAMGSSSPVPRNNITFGGILSKTSTYSVLNGVKGSAQSSPVLTTTAPNDDLAIGGNAAMKGSFAFISAAIWDRQLSDTELLQAHTELTTWKPPVLSADSWVGQSMVLTSNTVVRYKDSGYFVYTGITNPLQSGDSFRVSKQANSAWTFSARLKGKGKARLVMEAYLPVDGTVVKSPPINQNLTVVADPAAADYGVASVVDNNGYVWTRNSPPFYTSLGKVALSATKPDLLTTQSLMSPLLVDGRRSVWELKTAPYPSQAPYYLEWGIPRVPSEVEGAPPQNSTATDKYLLDAQGTLWSRIMPKPGSPPYYQSITPPYAEKPEYVGPDLSMLPPYYRYTGNQLWQIRSPIPSSGFYVLKDTYTTVATDPNTDPPGASAYVEKGGEVWERKPKPYYTNTGGMIYQGRIEGRWIDILPDDWQRLAISTTARFENGVSFSGCSWIDARVEVQVASPDEMLLSALLLDPNEEIVAEYFDGAMSESEEMDDYLWEDASQANNSISWYYYDRRARARWIYENMPRLVPANRSIQIFYYDYNHPYDPGSGAAVGTQQTRMRVSL